MGWYELLSICQENAEMQKTWRQMPPTACPNDGTPLESGPEGSGVLHCRFDGWQYPRDYVANR